MVSGRDCTCDEETEAHTCPFAEEINGDHETLCFCCTDCMQECANGI